MLDGSRMHISYLDTFILSFHFYSYFSQINTSRHSCSRRQMFFSLFFFPSSGYLSQGVGGGRGVGGITGSHIVSVRWVRLLNSVTVEKCWCTVAKWLMTGRCALIEAALLRSHWRSLMELRSLCKGQISSCLLPTWPFFFFILSGLAHSIAVGKLTTRGALMQQLLKFFF